MKSYLTRRMPNKDFGVRITRSEVVMFRKVIYSHFLKSGRCFPWRETADPYRILISEVMLQQTQTERVLEKYPQFLVRFPDFRSLADAPLRKVIAEWQGLGYNRRAIALKNTAEKVMSEFGGNLPSQTELLLGLPGIGPGTAAAIQAFVFRKPSLLLETNIRRVFIHFFFSDREVVHDREILLLIETSLDRRDPQRWYYALMDYGAMLRKLALNPNRKSVHYRRQPPFEGSDRQLRGKILKTAVGSKRFSSELLERTLNAPHSRIVKILEKLEKEGFLIKRGDKFRLS